MARESKEQGEERVVREAIGLTLSEEEGREAEKLLSTGIDDLFSRFEDDVQREKTQDSELNMLSLRLPLEERQYLQVGLMVEKMDVGRAGQDPDVSLTRKEVSVRTMQAGTNDEGREIDFARYITGLDSAQVTWTNNHALDVATVVASPEDVAKLMELLKDPACDVYPSRPPQRI